MPTEIKLQTPHLELAALRWGNPEGIPVLALHGWLDNAASFLPMAPWFEDMNIVAVDWPGHGRSQHRHPSARYYITEFAWDIHTMLDALGWDSAHLVGHSLGAAISSIFTAAAPERVRSMTMIDALGPYANQASDTAKQLRRASASFRGAPRARKVYASLDEMVKVWMDNAKLNEEAARLILSRAVEPVDGGLQWSYDPSLQWNSPVYFTEDQLLDCLQNIKSPTLTLIATPFTTPARSMNYQQRTEALANGRHELYKGGHHHHMEHPAELAGKIHDFIVEYDDPALAVNADPQN